MRFVPGALYFVAFFLALAVSCGQGAGGVGPTLKADAIGCGKQIAISVYTQIPTAFSGDNWQTEAERLAVQVGEEALRCAASDVLAILTARAGQAPATAAPEPLILHLRAFVAAEPAPVPR
jgi:hypothetical protein